VDAPPWEHAEDKDLEDLRMAVYAAQIDRVDQGKRPRITHGSHPGTVGLRPTVPGLRGRGW